MSAVVKGDLVRYEGSVWEVTSVFDTHTEGLRANLYRGANSDTGIDRCSAPVSELEVIR